MITRVDGLDRGEGVVCLACVADKLYLCRPVSRGEHSEE